MRKIVLNSAAEYQALNARLQGSPSKRTQAQESLKRLNPHVNFDAIETGTVVLLPDLPAFSAESSTSISGDAFQELRDEVLSSLDVAVARNIITRDNMVADHKELATAFKSKTLLRMAEAEPTFREQIDAAAETIKADQKAATENAKEMQAFKLDVTAELDALGRLFR